MIRLGNSARFALHEIDEFRQVGLDMSNVTHQKDIEQQVSWLAHTLADERFDLLENTASAMAKSRERTCLPSSALVEKSKSSTDRIPFRNFEGRRAGKGIAGDQTGPIAERT
jgi:hypothetical protein